MNCPGGIWGWEVQAITSSQRTMTQWRQLSPDSRVNVIKQLGVQGRVPKLFSLRELGITVGWDSLSNRRSEPRLLEQIGKGEQLTEHHSVGESGFGGPQLTMRQAEELYKGPVATLHCGEIKLECEGKVQRWCPPKKNLMSDKVRNPEQLQCFRQRITSGWHSGNDHGCTCSLTKHNTSDRNDALLFAKHHTNYFIHPYHDREENKGRVGPVLCTRSNLTG